MNHNPRTIALDSVAGRWTIAASVLGSGAAFLEGTVVNVALPEMAAGLGTGMSGLQWVLNGYLLSLSALMLLGGSLGDLMSRRRVFAWGLVGFAVTSGLCALAPGLLPLVVFRVLQGAAGALLVPNSLAMLEETFDEEDRGTAIGRWAGWSAISTAAGPLFGGWLVDAVGWRWVFASVIPFALAAAWIGFRHIPDRGEPGVSMRSLTGDLDIAGALLATLGLGGVIGALIAGPERGFSDPLIIGLLAGGVMMLAGFTFVEHRARNPLLPPGIFRSRQFAGANLVTLFVYAALSGVFFLLMIQLQSVLGYSALIAGVSLLPINALLLLLSPVAGRLSGRYGPRWPMTIGAAVAGAGALLFARVQPGSEYLESVLPAVLVFGLGLATFVAPITAAVLGAVPDRQAGVASAVNNAVARSAGLIATAALPLLAGLGGLARLDSAEFEQGFPRAMIISAVLCWAGAALSFLTIRQGTKEVSGQHPNLSHGCVGGSSADTRLQNP